MRDGSDYRRLMPLYEFECPKGHVTGKVYAMNDTRPGSVSCETCGDQAHRIFGTPTVVDDFPEHYNWSIGEIVKNRQHLRQIQKERGLQDYEKPKHSLGYDLVQERLRRGA